METFSDPPQRPSKKLQKLKPEEKEDLRKTSIIVIAFKNN